MKICAVILAAGSSRRMQTEQNKVLIKFEDKSALVRCLKTFEETKLFSSVVIVSKEDEQDIIRHKVTKYLKNDNYFFCVGGKERQNSVENALKVAPDESDLILVHDAARCFVTTKVIKDCVASAIRYGSGVAGIKATDTIKRVSDGIVAETLDREELVLIQTPQVFLASTLKKAYKKAKEDGFLGTDDSSLVERLGESVRIVEGAHDNIKLTTKADIKKGQKIVEEDNKINIRIGNGYDVHAFKKGRKLVLGGVEIPDADGLDGHSDADVLTHAIMDSLLGAARLTDIGKLFPDTDPKYKDISSLKLLSEVGDLLKKYGYSIVNIDSTLVMQAPKIAPYKEQMVENIARALSTDKTYVNVSATTTEGLGAIGRKEGAACMAVCLIEKNR